MAVEAKRCDINTTCHGCREEVLWSIDIQAGDQCIDLCVKCFDKLTLRMLEIKLGAK